MYKMFDKMFNKFVCNDINNDMKIISCMNNYYSACISIVNFERHDEKSSEKIS